MPKANKNKKSATLTFFKAPHLETTENVTRLGYTQFSVQKEGGIGVKSSQIASILSQQENEHATGEDMTEDINLHADGAMNNDSPDNIHAEINPYGLLDEEYIDHLTQTESLETLKRMRAQGDEALRDFVPQTDRFLEELIGLESRGCWPDDSCVSCKVPAAGTYQCIDCFGRQMLCLDCIVKAHATCFLHRIQRWDAGYFHRVSLKDLGLRIQLGHPCGEICGNPLRCTGDDFTLLHINGIHQVGIDFCGCGKENQLHTVQLIRARLFPATVITPKTGATIELLDYFSMLSYESKMSAYQFYQTLSRLTDNTGTQSLNDRYPALVRMAHEWRHLMLLKRAGRGHSPDGVAGTKQGECAVLCPACPHPGINMAENWKERPEHLKWLDAVFVGTDANFRSSRKDVSSHKADPGLSHGYSYFVEETEYREHLKNYIGQVEEKSTCSRHEAVNMSQAKASGQGLAATGIAAVVCTRHDMKRPMSVAQLQRGERHCNIDYIVYKTMKGCELLVVVFSYDVACQWSRHAERRMKSYTSDPYFFIFNPECKVTYLVPKFHLPAHIIQCRTQYSFNLTKNVGRTDGEAPERGWAESNDLAPSTKEMGPGSCRDTLDYHFGDANHKKVVGIGSSLLRKMMDAAREMAEHTIAHNELEGTISPDNISEWTTAVEEWEEDRSRPNPFVTTSTGPTQAAVRRQLAEDEKKMLEAGRDMALDDTVTPSVLIATGLDLEQEQRTYKTTYSKIWSHSVDRQHTKIVLRGNTLKRKIEAFFKYQILYMPAVTRLRDISMKALDPTVELKAHEVPLWLPSQIRSQIPVSEHYRRLEFDLRVAQASESLDELRAQLQVRAHLRGAKLRFARGQAANTRARSTMDGIEQKIIAIAGDYCAAYDALACLGPMLNETTWKDEYLLLEKKDIRDLSQGLTGQSEGRTEISWIWRKMALDRIDIQGEGDYRDAIRVQWAKSRARMQRFTEEVQLLNEEMLRVQRFMEWKARDWESKGKELLASPYMTPMRAEGIKAYALRQSSFYWGLYRHFNQMWQPVPAYVTRMLNIIDDPNIACPGELEKKKKKGGGRKGTQNI